MRNYSSIVQTSDVKFSITLYGVEMISTSNMFDFGELLSYMEETIFISNILDNSSRRKLANMLLEKFPGFPVGGTPDDFVDEDQDRDHPIDFFQLPLAKNFAKIIVDYSKEVSNDDIVITVFRWYLRGFYLHYNFDYNYNLFNLELSNFFYYDYQLKILIKALKNSFYRKRYISKQVYLLLDKLEANFYRMPVYINCQETHKLASNALYILFPLLKFIKDRIMISLFGWPLLLKSILVAIYKLSQFLYEMYQRGQLTVGVKILVRKAKFLLRGNRKFIVLLLLLVPGIKALFESFSRVELVMNMLPAGRNARNSLKSYFRLVASLKIQTGPKNFPQQHPGEFFEKVYKPVLGSAKKISGNLIWQARQFDFFQFKKSITTLIDWKGSYFHQIMTDALAETVKQYPTIGKLEDITSLALNDPGHEGRLSYEPTTAILTSMGTNQGPILPVSSNDGYSLDFNLAGRQIEIKPAGEFIGRGYGADAAIRELHEKREQFSSENVVLLLDATQISGRKIAAFRAELQDKGYGPDQIIVADYTEFQQIEHFFRNLYKDENFAVIDQHINNLHQEIPQKLFEYFNRGKIHMNPETKCNTLELEDYMEDSFFKDL